MAQFKTLVQGVLGQITQHLGEDAVFKPCKGATIDPVRVVFDNEYEIIDPNTETVISSNSPIILVRLSDFPDGVYEKDRFKLEGVWFRVWSVQEDGQGGARVTLHKMS